MQTLPPSELSPHGLPRVYDSEAHRFAHISTTHCLQGAEVRIPSSPMSLSQTEWQSPDEKDVKYPGDGPHLKYLLIFG